MSVDAGEAELVLPGETPGVKPAGVPAEASFRWESRVGEPDSQRVWNLVCGQARLAGVSVTEMTGEVVGARTPPKPPLVKGGKEDGIRRPAGAGDVGEGLLDH